MLHIYTDGACRGNPGPSSCAIVVRDDSGKVLCERTSDLGNRTNNEAEYHGLMMALLYLEESGNPEATIYMDSQLIVRHITGEYEVRSERLFKLWKYCCYRITAAGNVRVVYIPREKNGEADAAACREVEKRLTY